MRSAICRLLVVGVGLLTQPVVSAAIGWTVYGERLALADGIGALLICAALVLIRLPERGVATPAAAGPMRPRWSSPTEMNLDELRAALAPLVAKHAAFDGWSEAAIGNAAAELGVPADRARLAFPGRQGGDDRRLVRLGRRRDAGGLPAGADRGAEDPRPHPRAGDVPAGDGCCPSARRCAARSRSSPRRSTRPPPRASPGAAPTGSGGWPATPRPTSTITASAPS